MGLVVKQQPVDLDCGVVRRGMFWFEAAVQDAPVGQLAGAAWWSCVAAELVVDGVGARVCDRAAALGIGGAPAWTAWTAWTAWPPGGCSAVRIGSSLNSAQNPRAARIAAERGWGPVVVVMVVGRPAGEHGGGKSSPRRSGYRVLQHGVTARGG